MGELLGCRVQRGGGRGGGVKRASYPECRRSAEVQDRCAAGCKEAHLALWQRWSRSSKRNSSSAIELRGRYLQRRQNLFEQDQSPECRTALQLPAASLRGVPPTVRSVASCRLRWSTHSPAGAWKTRPLMGQRGAAQWDQARHERRGPIAVERIYAEGLCGLATGGLAVVPTAPAPR